MENKKLGIIPLVAMVISSSIGSGIFALPSELAAASAPGPALISWGIVGVGILLLVMSLNHLLFTQPHLTGIFSYADAGFGKFAGFISGWGYWLSSWLGNVAFATIFMSTLAYFFPIFGNGQNIPSIIGASILTWGIAYFINRGIETAAILNVVVTVCKLIPLLLVAVLGFIAFNVDLFSADFWGTMASHGGEGASIIGQINSNAIIMLWVFVGIEGASTLSARAKNKKIAGTATYIGLASILIIYVCISMIPYGIMTREELAGLNNPALAYVFERIVGSWGAAFINIGLMISIAGAWLSWSLFPIEAMNLMSQEGMLPKKFGKVNDKNVPTYALIYTSVLIQFFLFTLLIAEEAYNFAYSLCTTSILISYIFVAAYQVKSAYLNREKQGESFQLIIGILAVIFQIWAIVASGLSYLLLCSIAYIPGFYYYIKARKELEPNHRLSKKEMFVAALIVAGAILAVVLLVTGQITI